jgi:hypothetical protein
VTRPTTVAEVMYEVQGRFGEVLECLFSLAEA